ncbi:hypothetical protein VTK26DRAFT_6432 [Humicola hyalothermophila]
MSSTRVVVAVPLWPTLEAHRCMYGSLVVPRDWLKQGSVHPGEIPYLWVPFHCGPAKRSSLSCPLCGEGLLDPLRPSLTTTVSCGLSGAASGSLYDDDAG